MVLSVQLSSSEFSRGRRVGWLVGLNFTYIRNENSVGIPHIPALTNPLELTHVREKTYVREEARSEKEKKPKIP